MAGEQRDGADPPPLPGRGGWWGKVEDQWQKTKEHAETYPYVWASYIFVYGGLGVYITYRWRKLRQTEQRIRVLQEQLRKLVEAEETAASASSGAASSASKPNGCSTSSPSSVASPVPSEKPISR